jgi:hypothetical protein
MYPDSGRAELDCFKGVFDLEKTSFWGEGAVYPSVKLQCKMEICSVDYELDTAI